MKTIPDSVLEKICGHRPYLRKMVENLSEADKRGDKIFVRLIEKRIADAYLMGETKLTPLETFYLAACCHGRPYGK